MAKNLLFDLLLSKHLDKPFLFLPDGSEISRADFLSLSGRLAGRLKSLGVMPGDRVAVQTEKSPQALAIFAGCVRLGAILLPLNPAYTAAECDYFFGDAEPSLIVADEGKESNLRPLAERHGAMLATLNANGDGSLTENLNSERADFANISRDADDAACILYTSGTTGRAKGAMLTHENLLSNAVALAEIWRFSPEDSLLHALPIFHVHGLFTASNVALAAGSSMIFLPKFAPELVLRHLSHATAMMGVPTYYTRLLANPNFTRASAVHMRLFISGSAPLLPETHAEFEAQTGHRILERYGMSETGMNSSNPYDGERRPGTVGFPLPGVQIRIADSATGANLPAESIGGVEIKGPNVFAGYWRMQKKTQESFRPDGFFITGDIGKLDRDGYLHIVGREKDLIISGGLNIYPKEIEDAINALPGVLESAVIGISHPDFGESVVTIVTARKGADVSENGIIRDLRCSLANYKIPKRVFFADVLPRNTMGKVQKNILRQKYRMIFSSPESQKK